MVRFLPLCRLAASRSGGGGGVDAGWETRQLEQMVDDEKRGIFRTLDIGLPRPFNDRTRRGGGRSSSSRAVVMKAAPRERLMRPTQDWPSVWPAQRTFHPASVPLPVRQGFSQLRGQPTPGKYANAELMKVPNFLHLTPPAIRRHCEKLRAFCTALPDELRDGGAMEMSFPLTEVTSDYLNAGSSVRDARSRVVTLTFRLSELLREVGDAAGARDKFIRLVGEERYDPSTDLVTVRSDRLPHRRQNREYCEYLVRALFFESTRVEEWEEGERSDEDRHRFVVRPSEAVEGGGGGDDEGADDRRKRFEVEGSLAKVMNEGEGRRQLEGYKSSVRRLLGLEDGLPAVADRL